MGRVVCIVDGDVERQRALAYAVDEARCRTPAVLEVVAVAPPDPVLAIAPREPLFAWQPGVTGRPDAPAWAREDEQREAAHEHRTRERLDDALRRLPHPEGVTIVAQVLPHLHHEDALADLAIGADLVVVASGHGLEPGGLHTERVVRHLLRDSRVPVTLVP